MNDYKGELKLFITLGIVSAILLAVIYIIPDSPLKSKTGQRQTSQTAQETDSADAINADLDEIDLGDVDGEFEEIDRDINSL